MARTYGRLRVDIWDHMNNLDMSGDARLTFCALIANRSVSACGVMPLQYRKLAVRTGLDRERVESAVAEVAQAGWIAVDDDTEELALLDFAGEDIQRGNSNMVKGFWGALDRVESDWLRQEIVLRIPDDFPRLNNSSATALPPEPSTNPADGPEPDTAAIATNERRSDAVGTAVPTPVQTTDRTPIERRSNHPKPLALIPKPKTQIRDDHPQTGYRRGDEHETNPDPTSDDNDLDTYGLGPPDSSAMTRLQRRQRAITETQR